MWQWRCMHVAERTARRYPRLHGHPTRRFGSVSVQCFAWRCLRFSGGEFRLRNEAAALPRGVEEGELHPCREKFEAESAQASHLVPVNTRFPTGVQIPRAAALPVSPSPFTETSACRCSLGFGRPRGAFSDGGALRRVFPAAVFGLKLTMWSTGKSISWH